MTTDELIESLAETSGPVAEAGAGRLVWPSLAGAAVALAGLVLWLGLRPMAEATASASFWMKAGYALALAATGGMIAWRLGRPSGKLGREPLIGLAAIGVIAALAAAQLARAGPGGASALWTGSTWSQCPVRILILSTPVFLFVVAGLRRLAPTRLRGAGAAAGLLAGGVGATVYGLYCQESAAPFLLAWYTLGIGACVAIGALLGPRLLRW